MPLQELRLAELNEHTSRKLWIAFCFHCAPAMMSSALRTGLPGCRRPGANLVALDQEHIASSL
ncbi:MAG: hypothetical protein IPN75_17010 [Dechloromonas sp.]|uniref:Uncharacterized protein n=1 Tax=Candidatus Dechloromonas phosphorivorans TaxID=2899244 RepID=A0A9D7LQ72_9RHOO|nr:hypothetical protein [Candidatus Dechloromonas phosphorivorans]